MEQEQIFEFIGKRKKEDIVRGLDPLVKEWFFSRFEEFSETQLYGVLPIFERKSILISAPTGETKTLTAFLSILNYLVGLARKNELEDRVYSVYTSPLKALSNDIHVNLERPLKEIEEIAKKDEKKWGKLQKIRVGLRTGDTTPYERAKLAKNPPHILITTPESLAIMINSPKSLFNIKPVLFTQRRMMRPNILNILTRKILLKIMNNPLSRRPRISKYQSSLILLNQII